MTADATAPPTPKSSDVAPIPRPPTTTPTMIGTASSRSAPRAGANAAATCRRCSEIIGAPDQAGDAVAYVRGLGVLQDRDLRRARGGVHDELADPEHAVDDVAAQVDVLDPRHGDDRPDLDDGAPAQVELLVV